MKFIIKKEPNEQVKTHYPIAFVVSFLFTLAGSFTFLLGGFFQIYSFSSLNFDRGNLLYVYLLFVGLLMVALGQILKAVINSADQTIEILKLLREKHNWSAWLVFHPGVHHKLDYLVTKYHPTEPA